MANEASWREREPEIKSLFFSYYFPEKRGIITYLVVEIVTVLFAELPTDPPTDATTESRTNL